MCTVSPHDVTIKQSSNIATGSDKQQTGYCRTTCLSIRISLSCPFSFLFFFVEGAITMIWARIGLIWMISWLRNKSAVVIFFKVQVGHWKLKTAQGKDRRSFKHDNNQPISRDKGRNKRVFLSTAVAMEQCQTSCSWKLSSERPTDPSDRQVPPQNIS
jgi:hypothetical protein